MPFSPDGAPLARGYATFGDDSGHNGSASQANFGLLDEAVSNFGYAHLKKVHDVALALIERGYGRRPELMRLEGWARRLHGDPTLSRRLRRRSGECAGVELLRAAADWPADRAGRIQRAAPATDAPRCAAAQPLQRVQKGTRWTSMLGLAHSQQPLPRPAFVPNGYLFSQGDAYIKYFVTHDPTFDSAHFDVMRPGRHRQQVVWPSETIGAARRLGHARGCAGDAGCDRYRAGHQRAQAPLCRYPAFPRYVGKGEADRAGSFVCARE